MHFNEDIDINLTQYPNQNLLDQTYFKQKTEVFIDEVCTNNIVQYIYLPYIMHRHHSYQIKHNFLLYGFLIIVFKSYFAFN